MLKKKQFLKVINSETNNQSRKIDWSEHRGSMNVMLAMQYMAGVIIINTAFVDSQASSTLAICCGVKLSHPIYLWYCLIIFHQL